MAKAEDSGENGNRPIEERTPEQWSSMGEEGHGIKPKPLMVDHNALGEHHMIPGIAFAAEDDTIARED
jgi:hypothetical protein